MKTPGIMEEEEEGLKIPRVLQNLDMCMLFLRYCDYRANPHKS